MGSKPPRVLGQLLLEAGLIGEDELSAALAEQRRSRARLGEILVGRGVDAEHIAWALAEQLGLRFGAAPLEPDPAALSAVDREFAIRHQVVPLEISGRMIRVAVSDPLDLSVLDDLRFQTGRRVEPVVAAPGTIAAALALAYDPVLVSSLVERLPGGGLLAERGATTVQRPMISGDRGSGYAENRAHLDNGEIAEEAGGQGRAMRLDSGSEQTDPELVEARALRRASEAPPVVALVDLILQRAVAVQASDIHVEPAEGRIRVRARVDGLLREILELPAQTGAGIVSRLKIMAGLDIAIKRRPQDGRSAAVVSGREISLRISTLPAQGGEKVVLRILDPENAGRSLDELGFDPLTLGRFREILRRGHGVVLVTGPTGSGKTTTLYGALADLDRERRNILTLEDPVEYRLPGLTQVQVHRRAGLSFATALRSVLRQDPDIIMVGELRDQETVETALAAALTGHLVLSTLHTNDAPGAVTRLGEMGAPHYLVASALVGVLAQRLVRRICEYCRYSRVPTEEELSGLPQARWPDQVFGGRGCARCDGTGYRGRAGVYELLVVDNRIRELINRRASTDAIREVGRDGGLQTLGHDAWEKVRAGITSPEEVRAFTMLLEEEAPVCPGCGGGVRAGFMVCPACGRILRERCGCGEWLEEGWGWCAGCGAVRSRAGGG